MSDTAFDYLVVDICKIRKTDIADKLGLEKTEITHMSKRKRGVDSAYIEPLEKMFGVPCYYWLDEKPVVNGNQIRTRYVKRLTKEVKQKIDDYLFYKKFKDGLIVESEKGYNPYMKAFFDRDTDIVFEKMKYLLSFIVYAECEKDDYYDGLFYNRALILKEMLESIRNIGIDNTWEYAKALKEHRFKPVGMTAEEIEEYESLFGKIEEENTSE